MFSNFSPITGGYFLIFALAFVLFWLAAEAGSFLRRVYANLGDSTRVDFQFVVTACLTLLGLIVAFSFSMAVNRYDQRKNYEEQEANAIGTEYVRADLLLPRDAASVQALLRRYLDERIAYYDVDTEEQLRPINEETARLQEQLWSAIHPAASQPTAVAVLVIGGMNDVLNSQSYTQAAFWNRIPVTTWVLLFGLSLFCNVLVGYSLPFKHPIVLLILPFVLSVSLFLIGDIDSPRRGLINVQPQNLASLAASLKTQPGSPVSH